MAIANITNNILTDSGVATSSLQPTISLTTTGTSGAATFTSNTLNIPNYGSALSGYVPYTGATANLDLGAFSLTASVLTISSGTNAVATINSTYVGGGFLQMKASGTVYGYVGCSSSILAGTTNDFAIVSRIGTLELGANSARGLIFSTSNAATFTSSVSATNALLNTTETTGAKLDVASSLSKSSTTFARIASFRTNEALASYPLELSIAQRGATQNIELQAGHYGLDFSANIVLQRDGGLVLIGSSTVSGSSILQVTGAATFSSSVTAAGTSTTPTFWAKGGMDGGGTGKGNFRSSDAGGANYWDFGRDNLTTGNFVLTSNGGSPLLSINTLGGATFTNSAGITNGNGLNLRSGGNTASDANVLNFTSLAGTINVSMFSDAANSNTRLKSLGNLSFHTGNIAISADNERMTILSTGNVGIGTSSPNSIAPGNVHLDIRSTTYSFLEIGTTSTITNNDVGYLEFMNGNNTRLATIVGGADGTALAGYMRFSTSNSSGSFTERMRITSGGQVSIGPSGTVYGTNLLNVNGGIYATSSIAAVVAADIDMLAFVNTGATYSKACVVASMTATGGTGSYFFYGQQSTSTAAIKIFSNGNIQNTNNSYGAISDARLKENIKDATPKLDDLMKVKVRNYNLKGESNKQLGVISQELEAIFPNMIEESTNMGENMKIKGIKYSVFVPMLIKAVQELKAEIEILKNK